ncbi:hypothetical protein HUO13_34100 [Saccharopolyspora erythraea]|uniref:hypothetical protein n=1 Tax=Saccharopolyspora erythraea TaxID=1836 RepID=UPI001BA6CDF7|nr:hypothetical protein [Saccharopolyspora erythraea]QUH05142.1 hypothetical protein HUO13_34100 [Saccharopolyspora erythraea]
MGAIVVAITVGLVAVGLVAAMIILSALVLVGLKAANVAHVGGSWMSTRLRRRRSEEA